MKVLLLIDLINDMVAPGGRLASKGYHDFAVRHSTAHSIEAWRQQCELVVHVGLCFRNGYPDLPRASRLLGKAQQFGVAEADSFGSAFVDWARPQSHDLVLRKNRISPFYGTDLDSLLRCVGASQIVVGGVATDLAVSSAVRDAHDRDFEVIVAAGACVAANDADHAGALQHLTKIAEIASE